MNHEHKEGSGCCGKFFTWTNVIWWAKLTIAVLAIPSFGFIFAATAPNNSLAQFGIFIVACWFCTYLGMRLMQRQIKKDAGK